MTSPTRYPQELRERAVRMVLEHGGEYPSEWAALGSISAKLGMTRETLRRWVRRAQVNGGLRSGVTSSERERIRELEREVRELRRANEMADSTGRRNDLRELLQWCQIAECLAWPVVEAVLDPEQVGGGVRREVGAFG